MVSTNNNTNLVDIKLQNSYIDDEDEESLINDDYEDGYEDDDDGLSEFESETINDESDFYYDQLIKEHQSIKRGTRRQLQIVIEKILHAAAVAKFQPELLDKYEKEYSLHDIEIGKARDIEGLPEDTKDEQFESKITKNPNETFLEDEYERAAAIPFVRLDSPEPSQLIFLKAISNTPTIPTNRLEEEACNSLQLKLKQPIPQLKLKQPIPQLKLKQPIPQFSETSIWAKTKNEEESKELQLIFESIKILYAATAANFQPKFTSDNVEIGKAEDIVELPQEAKGDNFENKSIIKKAHETILEDEYKRPPTIPTIIQLDSPEPPQFKLPKTDKNTITIPTKRLEEVYNPLQLKPKQPIPQFSKSSIWGKTANDEEKVVKSKNIFKNNNNKVKEKGIFTIRIAEKKKDDVSEITKSQSCEIQNHPNVSNTKLKDDLIKPKFSSNSMWSVGSKSNNNGRSSNSNSNQTSQSKPQFSNSSLWTGRKRAPIQWDSGPTKKSCHSIHWDVKNNNNNSKNYHSSKNDENISTTTVTNNNNSKNYHSSKNDEDISAAANNNTTIVYSAIPPLIKKDSSSSYSNNSSITKNKVLKTSIWNTSIGATKTTSRINWGFPNQPQPVKKVRTEIPSSSSLLLSKLSTRDKTTSGRTKIFGTPIHIK